MNTSSILLYQNKDGNIKIDVRQEEESVWLTQEQMASLFGKGRSTITEHIANIFSEGELAEDVVCRNFRRTTQHGAIEGKTQEKEVKHYNLDVIISVGYRVKSPKAPNSAFGPPNASKNTSSKDLPSTTNVSLQGQITL